MKAIVAFVMAFAIAGACAAVLADPQEMPWVLIPIFGLMAVGYYAGSLDRDDESQIGYHKDGSWTCGERDE